MASIALHVLVKENVRLTLDDEQWEPLKKIKGHRETRKGPSRCGRKPRNDRLKLEGMLWILRCGAPWRDLPALFGPWQSVYGAFRRWTEQGLWDAILSELAGDADREYLMIDSSSSRVHQDAAGPPGGQLAHAMGRSKGGLSSKVHMACDALGYPLGFIVTAANVNDSTQCKPLLDRYLSEGSCALMDKGYDSDAIRDRVKEKGGVAVIAIHSRRNLKPAFDKHIYKERHRIENLFGRLKRFRRIATRYEKLYVTFAAMITIACVIVWLTL